MLFYILKLATYQARKEFICTWCDQKIKIRERYDRVTANYNKKLVSGVFHQDCRVVMEEAKVFKYEQTIRKENQDGGVSTEERQPIAG